MIMDCEFFVSGTDEELGSMEINPPRIGDEVVFEHPSVEFEESDARVYVVLNIRHFLFRTKDGESAQCASIEVAYKGKLSD